MRAPEKEQTKAGLAPLLAVFIKADIFLSKANILSGL
jgi:hypothetical protein